MINRDVVEIVEIVDRTERGVSMPFRCLGGDGKRYVVKGRNTNRTSLRNEWVAGCLGRRLRLPIPEFRIVEVPEELIQAAPASLRELGAGRAFGSVHCSHTVADLTPEIVAKVNPSDRRWVIAFDWWVRNGDRTLTRHGGNPNLMWDADSRGLVVIDHNLAFDRFFDERDFLSLHVFRSDWNDVAGDFIYRNSFREDMIAALEVFEPACDAMPDEWRLGPVQGHLTTEERAMLDTLRRCASDEFWNPMP